MATAVAIAITAPSCSASALVASEMGGRFMVWTGAGEGLPPAAARRRFQGARDRDSEPPTSNASARSESPRSAGSDHHPQSRRSSARAPSRDVLRRCRRRSRPRDNLLRASLALPCEAPPKCGVELVVKTVHLLPTSDFEAAEVPRGIGIDRRLFEPPAVGKQVGRETFEYFLALERQGNPGHVVAAQAVGAWLDVAGKQHDVAAMRHDGMS